MFDHVQYIGYIEDKPFEIPTDMCLYGCGLCGKAIITYDEIIRYRLKWFLRTILLLHTCDKGI